MFFPMAKCDLRVRPGALRGRPHGALSHGLAPGEPRLDDAGGDAAGCGGWWGGGVVKVGIYGIVRDFS